MERLQEREVEGEEGGGRRGWSKYIRGGEVGGGGGALKGGKGGFDCGRGRGTAESPLS